MIQASSAASRALKISAIAWFVAAVAGLWLFGSYIVALYGTGAVTGDWQRWNAVLPKDHGYMPGDLAGNIALGGHLLMAAILTFGGVVQLVPHIRAHIMPLHRWNGRLFILTAILVAATGLVINALRGNVAGLYMQIGNITDGLLVILSAVLTWRYARARNISLHQRWAMRTFILVNGVWFYRLGMMVWLIATQGAGHTDAFDGPFDLFIGLGHFLLPLAVLEIYMRVRDGGGSGAKWIMTLVMALITVITAAGIVAATLFMWLPNLR